MSVLTASALGVSFGAADIFSDVSLEVPDRARIALIGPNGSGKTSLLRLLAGLDRPSAGAVHLAGGTQTGYLSQHPDLPALATVGEYLRLAFEEVDALEERLRELERAIASGDDSVFEAYGEEMERYESLGGYEIGNRVSRVATGLGFSDEESEEVIQNLSGGQRTRVALGRLLLESPDLLFLDEPTNHLDLEAIEWLESYLAGWDGALVVVAHDRAFLDNVVDRIWELENGTLEVFRGNYSAYTVQKEERRARREAEYSRQRAEIARTEDFIRRNLAGQNTKQAQGRRTRLERLERIEVGRTSAPPALRVASGSRSGDKVVRATSLAIGYDDQVLANVGDLEIERGMRVALLGPNGAGKTTLLRTLLGELKPVEGIVRLGAALEVGYVSQSEASLVTDGTVLDQLTSLGLGHADARALAGRYKFSGDDALKSMGVLSGGERARLALARLAVLGANFLVLDEPTNHLDIASQEVLESVLSEFEGTLLMVSHDRFMVRRLCDTVWWLHVGRLDVFPDGFERFEMARRSARASEATDPEKEERIREREAAKRAAREAERAEQRRSQKLESLERTCDDLEQELIELAAAIELATSDKDVERLTSLGDRYAKAQRELDKRLAEWLDLENAS